MRIERAAFVLRDLIYPPRCPFCDSVVGTLRVCPDCLAKIKPLRREQPRLSFSEHFLAGMDGAAGVYHYRDEVRQAVLRMKYAGRRSYGQTLGNEMAQGLFGCTFQPGSDIITPDLSAHMGLEFDLVVPVPPSNRQRGYNPPQYLAQPLAKALHLPMEARALQKVRPTPRQEELGREERLLNLIGAFEADHRKLPPNARVLLVDDVITTGATMSACTGALRRAGASSVFGVSFAVTGMKEKLIA